jgi:PAS domain S-box-containing protein
MAGARRETIVSHQVPASEASADSRYRRLIENLPLVTYIDEVGPTGTTYYISPRFEQLIGVSSDEYAAMSWEEFFELVHPDDRDLLAEPYAPLGREGDSWVREYRMLARDGRTVWFRDVAAGESILEDGTYVVSGFMIDITEQREAESALRASETLNRRVLTNAEHGIVVLDREHRIVHWNPTMERLRNVSAEKVLGRDPFELFPDLLAANGEQYVTRALAGERVTYPAPHPFPQADGTCRYGVISVGPLLDDTGEVTGLLGTVRDVTEELLATESLRRHAAILGAVSESARLLFERPLEECALQVLEVLGNAVEASRAYIWTYEPTVDGLLARPVYEWCAPGVPSDPWEPFVWNESDHAGWLDAFRRGEAVHGPTRELSPRTHLIEAGIKSLADVPIFVEGALYGDIGFDDCVTEREWPAAEMDALFTAARVIGAAIERQRSEEKLRRGEEILQESQRLEAVARLAGGTAHDFNNLLTVIGGYLGLLREELPLGREGLRHMRQIEAAMEGAKALTGQLLAFSRRLVVQTSPVDLNSIVTTTEAMLRRLIPSDIEVRTVVSPAPVIVSVDANQVQQMLVNLALNACDAMAGGGRLTLSTDIRELDDSVTQNGQDLPKGRYAMLTVTDTGHGMDVDTLSRVFEPFFTTKAPGRGTGLGLATAYGFAKQGGGTITAQSQPGEGTIFTVYLPALTEAEQGRPTEPRGTRRERACTVLVAEDEEPVRTLIVSLLERSGYEVLAASSGTEAIDLARSHEGLLDLLITDVVMPRMSGRELTRRIRDERPEIGVLYVSGYTADEFVRRGVPEPDAPFLQKPFTIEELELAVHEALLAGATR